MKPAADGTTLAPKRVVDSVKTARRIDDDGAETWVVTVALACGHSFDLPLAEARTRNFKPRDEVRCADCVREAPPPGPKLTASQKRQRKRAKLSEYHLRVLVAVARGAELPARAELGQNSPPLLLVQLREKGYVQVDVDAAESRAAATHYVPTELGAAAAVYSSADEWNASDALARHFAGRTP